MSSNAVIEVHDASKVYRLYDRPVDRLKQLSVPLIKRMLRPFGGFLVPRLRVDVPRFREFWALRDVSLVLRPGETLGLIGQNGSGKSTLLQIICGILYPSSGSAVRHGRVAALLELGAGFNPEFTGRENVFLNASIYGLSHAEITERMQAIIDFAEIGEHIDQPVKTYSSGMFVRLAFSVIANVDADVLIIDEALAVGDGYFQQKCMRFLRRFQQRGSILFVSHDTAAMMNFCDRIVWLDHGRIRAQGDPKKVCEAYLAFLYQQQDAACQASDDGLNNPGDASASAVIDRGFGDGGARILRCTMFGPSGQLLTAVQGGETVELSVAFRAEKDLSSVIVGFIVKDRLGQFLFGDNTFSHEHNQGIELQAGKTASASFRFEMPNLAPGTYSIAIAVATGTPREHVQHHWLHDAFIFESHAEINTGVMIKIPMQHTEITVDA